MTRLEMLLRETPLYRENFKQGLAEGRLAGRVRAIVVVLEARGIAVSEAQRTVLDRARDTERLDALLYRVGTVASTAELLGE